MILLDKKKEKQKFKRHIIENFSDRLLKIVSSSGVTRQEHVRRSGIDKSTWAKWENGEAAPTIIGLCQLADYFEVSTDYLLGRQSEKMPDIEALHKDLGLSQTAIEALKRFNDEDVIYSTDGEAFEQGRCKALSVALSCHEFLCVVASFIDTKSNETGYHHEAIYNEKEGFWEGRLSPDTFAALIASSLMLVLESLRRGEGGRLQDYQPWIKEMNEVHSEYIQDQKGKETKNGEKRE